ncbi:MAG: ribonuclease HI [Firmicutes bacterium]|nr:ribonuclease HI [Bacillota bacterium]
MKKVTIYTDGACRGNPGPGGYGVILEYTREDGEVFRKELSAGYSKTTNNRMEILAAVVGLQALKTSCDIVLYSDSQYLVNGMTKGWVDKWQRFGWYKDAKRKEKAKNVDLWKALLAAMEPHKVEFRWVKGHAENPYNNRCDELAVAAALGSNLLEDKNYQG